MKVVFIVNENVDYVLMLVCNYYVLKKEVYLLFCFVFNFFFV